MAVSSHSPDASPPSVEVFLKTVVRSGLIGREELRAVLKAHPGPLPDDAAALAEYLIRTGKLSRFQARKLLKGVSRGLILASFQLLSPIGKGGMATVYLARDSRNGQLVALKVLPPQRARAKGRLLARFQREMELSRRVSHPHLARTFEVGEIQGVNYLAMEFIAGKTLSRLVTAEGPFPLGRAARLMAEVASGLEHAHQQGLIHRDIKPSNILVTPHDHAKVLDLGLAMMQGEPVEDPEVTGGRGYIVGTMDYIAPEQTHDATGVDGRADIYSLGCTLYHILNGRPPFPGGTSREKIHRHRREEPEPLLKLRPDLPAPFAALVHQMMAKDPRQRFPSARAVEEQLWRWTEGSPQQPPDQSDDAAFVEAVAALQKAEPASDGSLSSLELLPEEQPGGRRLGLGCFVTLIVLAAGLGVLLGVLINWVGRLGQR